MSYNFAGSPQPSAAVDVYKPELILDAYRSIDVDTPVTGSNIICNVASINLGGDFNTTSGLYTAPEPGLLLIEVSVRRKGGTANPFWILVQKNSTNVFGEITPSSTTRTASVVVSIPVVQNDILGFTWNFAGGSASYFGDPLYTYFRITKLA